MGSEYLESRDRVLGLSTFEDTFEGMFLSGPLVLGVVEGLRRRMFAFVVVS